MPLINRKVMFALSPLVLVAMSFAYVAQNGPKALRGATIQSKIYSETPDGKTKNLGSKTTYVSASGNWSTVRRGADNEIDQVLIADADRGGVFLISKEGAAKLGSFQRNTFAVKASDYRKSSQYAGEISFLGYAAFVQRIKGDKGELRSEVISIPEFRLPVKTTDFEEDGSKTVTEATSITLGEPEETKTRLSVNMPVTMDIPDPKLHPQP